MLMDPVRIVRAIGTNLVAHLAPEYYLKITAQTGRGDDESDPEQAADYFYQCFEDYLQQLSLSIEQAFCFLKGKTLLEYGPGDTPGVALLFYAFGAESVALIDRFPMLKLSAHNQAIIEGLLRKLPDPQRQRALESFNKPGDIASGFNENLINYQTNSKGLSGLDQSVDMIYSRAVLEHVDDLQACFADMFKALKPGGLALHQVDLKSHGLHQHNPLDFLTWPDWLWRLMYSAKGVPNRWRLDKYRELAEKSGFITTKMRPTMLASHEDIAVIKAQLAPLFRDVNDQDLACLGFWVHLHKPA